MLYRVSCRFGEYKKHRKKKDKTGLHSAFKESYLADKVEMRKEVKKRKNLHRLTLVEDASVW